MSIIYGFYDPVSTNGGYSNPGTDNISIDHASGNYVFGAFTGDDGLPTSVTSQGDLDALWAAMEGKFDQIDTAGVDIDAVVNDLRARGGAGGDTFDVNAVTGYVDMRDGNDRVTTTGGGDYTLIGGNGRDSLYSGAGDDVIDAGRGDDRIYDSGNGSIDAGDGKDLMAWVSTADLVLDGAAGTWTSAIGDGTFGELEYIIGGSGADHMTFGGGVTRLNGNGGDDTLVGVDGFDFLEGGGGADLIYASLGDDILRAGGRAISGEDTLDCSLLGAGVTISLAARGVQETGGAGNDRISGFENIIGTNFADTLTGRSSHNELVGGLGADLLSGGRRNDTLDGGRGDDTLVGGREVDQLTGGDGRDLFVWNIIAEARPGRVTDTITDLQHRDTIDVSAIDADSVTDGNQAFVIGGAQLSGVAGELAIRYDANTDRTVFSFDVDGDGQADMIIRALGDHSEFVSFVL